MATRISDMIKKELSWTKVTKKAKFTSVTCKSDDERLRKGFWRSGFSVPFSDSQTTIEFIAWDGVVFTYVCYHGQDRGNVQKELEGMIKDK